jgi:cobalt-zinc-cadmium resistance protein CzcA
VIVGRLLSALVMSVFLMPTLYVWFASPDDRLPQPSEESV